MMSAMPEQNTRIARIITPKVVPNRNWRTNAGKIKISPITVAATPYLNVQPQPALLAMYRAVTRCNISITVSRRRASPKTSVAIPMRNKNAADDAKSSGEVLQLTLEDHIECH